VTGAVAGLAVAVALLGLPALWAAAAAGLAAFALGRLAVRRIGGVSGDVLGAVQQLGEILVLLVAAAVTNSSGWESPILSVLALVSGSR
jgi:adenosylcobinamide-GDP ribazoletransferase